MSEAEYPLEGIRVLDLTQYVAGPYCTQVLADLGAAVLKVERPGAGDVYRRQGPVFANGESASFLTLNRGKRSLELDLGSRTTGYVIEELLAESDVLVENMRPGALAKFDLDYEAVAARHPQPRLLLDLRLRPGGAARRRRRVRRHDPGAVGADGDDRPSGPAAREDPGRGARLRKRALRAWSGSWRRSSQRERTGRGQWVQTSLLECALGWLSMHVVTYLLGGEEPGPLGSRSPFFAPYEAYRTADGYLVVVGTGGRDAWGNLCRELGLERLVDDPRFATNADRVANAEELRAGARSRSWSASRTSGGSSRLEAVGVACAPVQRLHEVLDSEQAKALAMIGTLAHPTAGDVPTVRLPLTLSEARTTSEEPPPALGSANRAGDTKP